MKMQTKASYNLLRLNAQESSLEGIDPWMVEDMRLLSLETLFERLSQVGVSLDRDRFVSQALSLDTPEEFAQLLVEPTWNETQVDKVYLLVFELWRQLVPEKQSLSIFCDELDHRIELYDACVLENPEAIQDVLANLLEILEENADEGEEPRAILRAISEYCAHDLEGFLYDYVSDLLDADDVGYASELLEGFLPFVSQSAWFSFLEARILSYTDVLKANACVAKILSVKSHKDSFFLFDILRFLSVQGDHRLFLAVIQTLLAQLKTEEEFRELLRVTADYYRRLDQDEVEGAIDRLLRRRFSEQKRFDPLDPDVQIFAESLK